MVNNIIQKILGLSVKKQLLFGVCCCDRIVHCYQEFEDERVFSVNIFKGGTRRLFAYLEDMYKYTIECSPAVTVRYTIDTIIEGCIQLAPDTELCSDYTISVALNCASAVANVGLFIRDNNIKHIVECSRLTSDSIELIDLSRGVDEGQREVNYLNEIELQLYYIDFLNKYGVITSMAIINQLRLFNGSNRI